MKDGKASKNPKLRKADARKGRILRFSLHVRTHLLARAETMRVWGACRDVGQHKFDLQILEVARGIL